MNKPEANEGRQLSYLEMVTLLLGTSKLFFFLRNARNCGFGKIKGSRNCGYARTENLACAVFRVFSSVVDCSKVRFSQLCKLLLLSLLLGFLSFVILYCSLVNGPGQQKHQFDRNEEVSYV